VRILLDSRDLIDLVEHGRPVNIRDFDIFLRNGSHQLVLSFTCVRELASPLAAGTEFMQIRPLLQSVERLPLTYIKETTIAALEIESAVDAFVAGTEYQSCLPFVTRWDRTLVMQPGEDRSDVDNWVNLRLDEIIYLMHKVNLRLFAPPEHYLAALKFQFERDRELLAHGRTPARQHFISSTRKHAASHGVRLPEGREDEFAEWVYRNPDRCPGLRLNHEVYRALMANYTDVPEIADFSDFAHIFTVPYLDAVTLDRRMRHYTGVASRKVTRFRATQNYRVRLYENTADVMQRLTDAH
jgi:hypothetical protein